MKKTKKEIKEDLISSFMKEKEGIEEIMEARKINFDSGIKSDEERLEVINVQIEALASKLLDEVEKEKNK